MSACLCCTWWVAAVLLLNALPVPRCFPIFYFPPSWHNSTHCPPGPRPTEGLCACIPPQLRCFSPGPLTASTTAPLPSHKKTMSGMWWVNYNPPLIPHSSFIVGDPLSPRFHLHPPSQKTHRMEPKWGKMGRYSYIGKHNLLTCEVKGAAERNGSRCQMSHKYSTYPASDTWNREFNWLEKWGRSNWG